MENNSAVANRKIQTRSQKLMNGTGDDLKEILNNVGDDQPEVKALIQDQVYHSFVEKILDPNQGPLKEDGVSVEDDDFVPNESSILEADDGGSSEDDLDDEDQNFDEAELDRICVEARENPVAMLAKVPPAMKDAYKKRFPGFWRMQQGITTHSGLGYDQEDDPDYEDEEKEVVMEGANEVMTNESGDNPEDDPDVNDDTLEGEDSDSSDESDEEPEVIEVLTKEIMDLSSKVEDMVIPDDSLVEDPENQNDADEDADEESSDDEIEEVADEPSIIDLVDENKDMVYDDDKEYEPVEVDSDSSDSFISANDSDSSDSDADLDESEIVEDNKDQAMEQQ